MIPNLRCHQKLGFFFFLTRTTKSWGWLLAAVCMHYCLFIRKIILKRNRTRVPFSFFIFIIHNFLVKSHGAFACAKIIDLDKGLEFNFTL